MIAKPVIATAPAVFARVEDPKQSCGTKLPTTELLRVFDPRNDGAGCKVNSLVALVMVFFCGFAKASVFSPKPNCRERLVAASVRLIDPSSERLDILVKHLEAILSRRGPWPRQRILRDFERATHNLMLDTTFGEVRARHSLLDFTLGWLYSEERFFFLLGFFCGFREFSDGLAISSDLRAHPMAEITLVHEMSHLSRVYNWLGYDSSAHKLHKLFTDDGILYEEGLAFADEYQFIVEAFVREDVENLYVHSDVLGGKAPAEILRNLSRREYLLSQHNLELQKRVRLALSSARSEYVAARIDESYLARQADLNAGVPPMVHAARWMLQPVLKAVRSSPEP